MAGARALRLAGAIVLWAGAFLAGVRGAGAQTQDAVVAIGRALDLEQAGRLREALVVWREAIARGEVESGILGLERVFSQLAEPDSVLPALAPLLARAPADRTLRGVQLRTLRSLGREAEARAAFDAWRRLVPRDPVPYREYAGQLLRDGLAAAADTVLQDAARDLGSTKELTIEVAQLRAALGLWGSAAAAWRDALARTSYLEQAAVFSLGPAPAAQRESVRRELARPPATAAARRALAGLELQWGAARDAWRILSTLTAADSAYGAWDDFAQEAERRGEWPSASDALAAMYRSSPSAPLALRAATAAIAAGEPAAALPLIAAARSRLDPAAIRTRVLPLEVRALTQVGRTADAEALVARDSAGLDPETRRTYARQFAWGWIRTGDVERARSAIGGASGDDEDEVGAWLALFDGDFVRARKGLRRPADASASVVTAMSLLGRTRADSSRTVGAAFLALARTDSARAAERFERAADELPDAAPLLLALAARIQSARRNDAAAIGLWRRIVERYAAAPEAAEADLEWARTLRRTGDARGAVDHLEHLILTYPESALVPQARRELEAVRTGAAQE